MLGARVVERQRAACELCELRLLRQLASHQFGNAEIEQAHLTLCGHQNIGGFQIAMHHQPCMSMGDGTRHLQQQAQTLVDTQRALFAIHVNGLALDVFQGEVGSPLGIQTRVVNLRNIRMIEARQNVAFAPHALGQPLRPADARQLQRYLALEAAVGTRRQPYRAHAADAQLVNQAVRTDQQTDVCDA